MNVVKSTRTIYLVDGQLWLELDSSGKWDIKNPYSLTEGKLKALHAAIGVLLTDMAAEAQAKEEEAPVAG